MGLFIIISSIATLRYGTALSSWEGRITLKDIYTEIRLALTNKTFVIFFFGSFGLSVAWGLGNTLTLYINTYFWELSGTQITLFLPMYVCLLYTSPSPRDRTRSRMPSSA